MKRHLMYVFVNGYAPLYNWGGITRSVENFAHNMAEAHDLRIVSGACLLGEQKAHENVKINTWQNKDKTEVYYFYGGLWQYLRFLWTLENDAYFYVHSFFSFRFGILPLLLAKRKNAKVILNTSGMLSDAALLVKPLKKKIYLKLSNWLGFYQNIRFQATSELEKQDILKNIANATVVVVPHFPVFFHYTEKQKVENYLFLTVGRIVPIKNLDFVLRALSEKPLEKPFTWKIAGALEDQNYAAHFFAEAKKIHNLHVIYLGELDFEHLQTKYEKVHFYLCPSWSENFGHAIVEAMMRACVPILGDKTPFANLQNIGFDLPFDLRLWCDTLNKANAMPWSDYEKYSKNSYDYIVKTLHAEDIKKAFEQNLMKI